MKEKNLILYRVEFSLKNTEDEWKILHESLCLDDTIFVMEAALSLMHMSEPFFNIRFMQAQQH